MPTMTCSSDLLIIGGGPSGLSAAINGASEGLVVRLLDSGASLGGQARESAAIENYPGFPESVTGHELMTRFVKQAQKFNTQMVCPVAVSSIETDGKYLVVCSDDYHEYVTRSVIISIGLIYRRLQAKNNAQFIGRGVFYGVPTGYVPPKGTQTVLVVGGANSAGQAVLNLAKNKKLQVRLIIRKAIDAQMSTYLIERIRAVDNIEVVEGAEVVECCGESELSSVYIQTANGVEHCHCTQVFIYIGATPRTRWLKATIEMDDTGYVRTWMDVTRVKAELPFQTSIAGVFAAGDVRAGSTKRIANGVGEGASALQMVHRFLASW